MRIQTQTTLPQRLVGFEWCSMKWNSVDFMFSQLFQFFGAFFFYISHVIVHPKYNCSKRIPKAKQACIYLYFVLQNHQSYQLSCVLFHFRTWHFVTKCILLGVPSWKFGNYAYFTFLLRKVFWNNILQTNTSNKDYYFSYNLLVNLLWSVGYFPVLVLKRGR